MYNAQTTKDRIKSMCKLKKINMENMLSECALGVNAIRQINDTKGMASFSLAKIADYLDCSVDYLLGRDTDTALTEKQKWLIDAYDNLDEEYQRLIDKRIEQYSKEQDEELVFEKIRRREEKQLKEILAKERKTDVNIPASK